jgi:hypothetical protein
MHATHTIGGGAASSIRTLLKSNFFLLLLSQKEKKRNKEYQYSFLRLLHATVSRERNICLAWTFKIQFLIMVCHNTRRVATIAYKITDAIEFIFPTWEKNMPMLPIHWSVQKIFDGEISHASVRITQGKTLTKDSSIILF